ncbi:hypothetical protein X797_012383 [Metarhizium robertsii]|uniref:Uncharacterized protein n=1 Tax=Metarhizium robertsii TaxID=568076 RepID=A0A014P030_9HYPO|nr:hypothetical protein X797_012383 [Metarhizium robertsii]
MMMQALLSPLYPKHFALSLKLRPGRIFSQSSASPFCRSARHAFSQSSLELFLRSSIIMYSLNKLASFPLNKVLIPSSQDESDRIQNLSALCSPSTPKHGLCRPNRLGSFNAAMGQVKMETCTRCKERWFAMDLKDGVCHACFLRDKGDKTPFLMSGENEMDPGELPAHLPELTQVEEMINDHMTTAVASDYRL